MAQKKLLEEASDTNENPLEVFSLDAMDGYEFQQFIAHLFNKLGYGAVEEIRQVRDAGQDIRIRAPDGRLLIIECKHHPKGTIGRPTVQKLHSAVISSNARKGMVVTTGHFSRAAIQYADKLGAILELMDSKILYDMARRANIKILQKGETTTVFHIEPPPPERIVLKVIDNVFDHAQSYPHTPHQLAKISMLKTVFTPAYRVTYNINEDFSTSVGIIHRLHVSDDSILINGSDGELLGPIITRRVTPSLMVEHWSPQEYESTSLETFKIGYTRVKEMAINHIQRENTQTVSYIGANNVLYTKECIPHRSKIFLLNITQVYVPIITASCSILTRRHEVLLCGNKYDADVVECHTGRCELCYTRFGDRRLLCNSCGRVVCLPKRSQHSYVCEVCGMTLCRLCAYWTRKYLIFKKLCRTRAEQLNREGKTIMKFRYS